MTERGHLHLPSLTAADRLAFFDINALCPQAFVLTDTPQGTRLEAGPYVGVFALPSFTLQVQPKAEIGTRNLLLMLTRIQGRSWTLPPASLTLNHTDLQEELAALFVVTLNAEVQRGLLRRSQTVREDLPVLRGRLRVADYLRRSDPTKLPVEYIDLTTNHPVNRLFLLVLERLSARVRAPQVRKQVAALRVRLREAGVTPWPAPPHQWQPFVLNRLQRRYDLPLGLARLLLEGWGSAQEAGGWLGQAFAFNMDIVFERFLTCVLLEDVLPGSGYVGHAQRPFGAKQYLFDNQVQELKPDLTICEGSQVRLVIDFKNKRPADALGREDLYQMYAYARHLHADRVLLLSPGEVTPAPLQATQGSPLQITAAGVDLQPNLHFQTGPLQEQLRAHLRHQGLSL
jgi:5-methylcytosine-specific restriction enzyme subunit McrC